jgi:hypothetical protein
MLSVVSSAVFLSVASPITVGFGSSFQLLNRDFSFRHGGEGGRSNREEGERSGKARVVDQRASTLLSICLSDPQGRDIAAVSRKTATTFGQGTTPEASTPHIGREVALVARNPLDSKK